MIQCVSKLSLLVGSARNCSRAALVTQRMGSVAVVSYSFTMLSFSLRLSFSFPSYLSPILLSVCLLSSFSWDLAFALLTQLRATTSNAKQLIVHLLLLSLSRSLTFPSFDLIISDFLRHFCVDVNWIFRILGCLRFVCRSYD